MITLYATVCKYNCDIVYATAQPQTGTHPAPVDLSCHLSNAVRTCQLPSPAGRGLIRLKCSRERGDETDWADVCWLVAGVHAVSNAGSIAAVANE